MHSIIICTICMHEASGTLNNSTQLACTPLTCERVYFPHRASAYKHIYMCVDDAWPITLTIQCEMVLQMYKVYIACISLQTTRYIYIYINIYIYIQIEIHIRNWSPFDYVHPAVFPLNSCCLAGDACNLFSLLVGFAVFLEGVCISAMPNSGPIHICI